MSIVLILLVPNACTASKDNASMKMYSTHVVHVWKRLRSSMLDAEGAQI